VAESIDPRTILDNEGPVALRARVSVETVAAAWCRYIDRSMRDRAAGRPEREWEDDPDGWAGELYFEEEFWDVSRRKEFIRLIAELAPNDEVLLTVGAQGLEDFITDDEECLLWIEEQAAASGRFKKALQNVYVSGLRPESVVRLERAAGGLSHKPQ